MTLMVDSGVLLPTSETSSSPDLLAGIDEAQRKNYGPENLEIKEKGEWKTLKMDTERVVERLMLNLAD